MLMPSIFGENLFDDWFEFPFRDLDKTERKPSSSGTASRAPSNPGRNAASNAAKKT